jgi:pyruvate kinase
VDDGLIGMEVTAIEGNKVICKVLNNGDLGENKGSCLSFSASAGRAMETPGRFTPLFSPRSPLFSTLQKDKQDLIFGCEQGVDFVAASFIRKRSDVVEIRESTPCSQPKIRSCLSFSASAGRAMETPGRFTPLSATPFWWTMA